MSAIIEIKWNGKKFPVEFSNAKELAHTTVRELKSKCERITGVNAKDMKINAFGALMNNDDMPLSVYGLRPGCFVTLKVNKNAHPKNATHDEPSSRKQANHQHQQQQHQQQQHQQQQHQQQQRQPQHQPQSQHAKQNNAQSKKNKQEQPLAKAPQESTNTAGGASAGGASEQALEGEALLLDQLKKIQEKTDNEIAPQVRKYEKDAKEFLNQPTKTDKEKKKQIYMGAYLGEQLMHVFFDLDAFICGPDNLNARQKRKEAVKSAQELLDKVDEIKGVVKKAAVVDEVKE